MKKLILALIIATSAVYSFERVDDSYVYGAVGTDLILPAVSIGSREWDKDTGIDVNVSLSSLIMLNRLTVNVSYLKKFNNSTYVGIGGGVFFALFVFDEGHFVNGGIFPSLKFGKEFEHNFHEVSIAMPQVTSNGTTFIPVISYRYGF